MFICKQLHIYSLFSIFIVNSICGCGRANVGLVLFMFCWRNLYGRL